MLDSPSTTNPVEYVFGNSQENSFCFLLLVTEIDKLERFRIAVSPCAVVRLTYGRTNNNNSKINTRLVLSLSFEKLSIPLCHLRAELTRLLPNIFKISQSLIVVCRNLKYITFDCRQILIRNIVSATFYFYR